RAFDSGQGRYRLFRETPGERRRAVAETQTFDLSLYQSARENQRSLGIAHHTGGQKLTRCLKWRGTKTCRSLKLPSKSSNQCWMASVWQSDWTPPDNSGRWGSIWRKFSTVKTNGKQRLPDRAPLDYAPDNEQGVIYLFSHLARKRFGLRIERVQAGFPD